MSPERSDYGDATVVTVTFKGGDHEGRAARLERRAKLIDPKAGIFTETVDIGDEDAHVSRGSRS